MESQSLEGVKEKKPGTLEVIRRRYHKKDEDGSLNTAKNTTQEHEPRLLRNTAFLLAVAAAMIVLVRQLFK
jgi:hypothetical protein